MKSTLFKTFCLILLLLGYTTQSYASDFEAQGAYYTITSMNDLEVRLDSLKYTTEIFTLTNNVNYNNRNLSLKQISENAFQKAVTLKELSINVNLELPDALLKGLVNLETLAIENDLETIPASFCEGCSNLKNLILPSTVKTLETSSFNGCENLSYFSTIPKHIILIERSALKANKIDLENMVIEPSNENLHILNWDSNDIYPYKLSLGRNLINERNGSADPYTLAMGKNLNEIIYSEYVTELPRGFFSGNDNISSMSLPANLTTIPQECFLNCSNLTNITIPSGVTDIMESAFNGTSLTSLPSCSNLRNINYRAFYNSKIETLKFDCPVEYIGDEAFNTVKNVSLPSSLKTVEADAFGDLETLIIEEGNDTLYIGTKILTTNTIKSGTINNTKQEAEASPGVKSIYLKTITSHKINKQIMGGRPIKIRDIVFYSGEEISDWGSGYGYCYYNNYIYLPSIVSPNVSSLFIDNNINNLSTNSEATTDSIKSIRKSTDRYGYPIQYCYLDVNTFIPNGILNPSQCENIDIISINNINPPIISSDFPNSVYLNATLRVPLGCKSKYENADYWKGFWNIEEVDFSNENIWDLPVSLQGLSLNVSEATLNISESLQLEATPIPDDASLGNLMWSSSDERIAAVNEDGLVFALSEGLSVITAIAGSFSASCVITVASPIIEAEQIILNTENIDLTIGDSFQLEATVYPENTTDKALIWTSSKSQVASVSESGLIEALSLGTATITVTCGEITASCEITVKRASVEYIELTDYEIDLGEEEWGLTATIYPETAGGTKISWSTSNDLVKIRVWDWIDDLETSSKISINRAGKDSGVCEVTATAGDISASCVVNVLPDAGIESLLANPESEISIYTTEGILIKKECKAEDLKSLAKGVYIVISGKDRYKISI